MSTSVPKVAAPRYVAGGNAYIPRAVAIIDGYSTQPTGFHVDLNAHGSTNKASLTIPNIDANQIDWTQKIARDQPGLSSSAVNLPQEKPITIAIYAGFVTNPAIGSTDLAQLQKLFFGLTDMYHIRSLQNELTFECRSLASVLIQDKVTTAAQNMTGVQFIQFMCAKWGLKTDIRLRPGQQSASLQTVYSAREIVGLHSLPAWDVFKLCAQVDDVDVWEDLGIVHYVEPGQIKRQTLAVDYGRDLDDIDISHSPWFNKNIEVEVRNYSRQTRTTFFSRKTTNEDGSTEVISGQRIVNRDSDFGTNGSTSESTRTNPDGSTTTSTSHSSSTGGLYKSGVTGTGYGESTKQRYSYVLHDATPEQVQAYRNAKWRQISMHEYQADLSLTVTPRILPYLDVTSFYAVSKHPNAKANDTYWPRSFSIDFTIQQEPSGNSEGFSAKIMAVNHRLADGEV